MLTPWEAAGQRCSPAIDGQRRASRSTEARRPPGSAPSAGETRRVSEHGRRDRRAAAEGTRHRDPPDLRGAPADCLDGVSERLLARAVPAGEAAQGLDGFRQVAVGEVGLPALLDGHRVEMLLERFARERETVGVWNEHGSDSCGRPASTKWTSRTLT